MAEKKQIEKDCRNVGSEKCGGPELLNSRLGKAQCPLSQPQVQEWFGHPGFCENLPDQWVRRYRGHGSTLMTLNHHCGFLFHLFGLVVGDQGVD